MIRRSAMQVLFFLTVFSSMEQLAIAEDLRIQVADPEGRKIAGAKVSLLRQKDRQVLVGAPVFIGRTDRTGSAVFPHLVPGSYDIKVTSPGYVEVMLRSVPFDDAVPPRVSVGVMVVVLNEIRRRSNSG